MFCTLVQSESDKAEEPLQEITRDEDLLYFKSISYSNEKNNLTKAVAKMSKNKGTHVPAKDVII